MHDLIIIGGGPAGLAAATYALGTQLDVVLVCASFGGKAGARQQLADQIGPEHLVGEEAFKGLWHTVAAHPTRIVEGLVVGLFNRDGMFHVMTEGATLRARAVIVATGAQPTMLGIPHERQFIGHGLGYSIATHAHLAAGREVAVVGTTARALRGVAELVQRASRILLIAPYPGELDSVLGQRLRADPRIHLLEGYTVAEVETNAGAVHAILVTRRGAVQRLPVQAVFVDLGLVPNSQMLRQFVDLDAQGFIIVDAQHQTSQPGIFAAGDVTSAIGEQILIAIGEGARAAQSAYDYILAQRLGLQSAVLSVR